MFTRLLKFIIPTNIRDPEEAKLTEFLFILILITVITSVIYGGVVLAIIEKTILALLIPVLVILSGGLSVIIVHRGYFRVAVYLFMLGAWLTFTVASVILFGGITSPTIALYVLILIAVGLMLGEKPAFFFAGMTLAGIILMFFGEILDIIPEPLVRATPIRFLLIHSVNLAVAAVLVRQAIKEINKSKAHANKRALELENFIASMDNTITKRTHEIAEQKIFFETLFNNIPVAVVSVDPSNKIVACNRSFEELFDYQQSEVLWQVLDPLMTTEETLAEAENYTRQTQMGSHPLAVCKRKRKDGSLVDVEMQGVPVIIDDKHVGALAIYRDITESLLAEEILKANEARFRSLFEDSPISLREEDFSSVKEYVDELRKTGVSDFREYFNEHSDSVLACAQKIKILNVNQATITLYKAGSKEKMLTNVSEVLGEDSLDVFKEELIALVEGALEFACEIHQKRFDGETIIGDLRLSIAPGYEDSWEKVYVSIQDITERINLETQIKESLAKMEVLATTDPLTGLLNRRAIIDTAKVELARANREGTTLGLALVDMDYLKDINDQHGHVVGDTALQMVAKTLKDTSRIYDQVGRWGGDEFLVVIPQVDNNNLLSIVDRLKDAINRAKINLPNGDEFWLEACIGITSAPGGKSKINTINELLVIADKALYHAKELGRNQIVFFDIHHDALKET